MNIGQAGSLVLGEDRLQQMCRKFFKEISLDGKKLLIIIPDHTRTAPMDVIFRILYTLLADRVRTFDVLVALGTHPPMSEESIYRRVGIDRDIHQTRYRKARFFNHHWDIPSHLRTVGILSKEDVEEISGGLLRQKVEITINKMIYDYDTLLIAGPTFPHEVMGFSGGNKYLFPGISGPEFLNVFHWLGALITNPVIIGIKDTPVRRMVDRAASMLPMERLCLSMVVHGNAMAGLFFGTPEKAFSEAADLSNKLHIIYKDHPFTRVLSCAPEMYDDLWTGGKCMYKLDPVVADGGELIIYAPHIREVSVTHGKYIEKIGYHVRDYFAGRMQAFKDIPLGVMAHSTHVRGIGTFENGLEKPRIQVTLATGIPEAMCRKINLGYLDPGTIDFRTWRDREDERILFVPKAGETLYRLVNDPFRKASL